MESVVNEESIDQRFLEEELCEWFEMSDHRFFSLFLRSWLFLVAEEDAADTLRWWFATVVTTLTLTLGAAGVATGAATAGYCATSPAVVPTDMLELYETESSSSEDTTRAINLWSSAAYASKESSMPALTLILACSFAFLPEGTGEVLWLIGHLPVIKQAGPPSRLPCMA